MRADQKAIDQIRFQVGLGGAADDQHLVDVRDQEMLPPAAVAAEHAVPRLDPFDDAFACAGRAKQHPIAGGHHVPLVGGERPQQPPRDADEQAFRRGFDRAVSP